MALEGRRVVLRCVTDTVVDGDESYSLLVVDEAHHVYGCEETRGAVERFYASGVTRRLLCSDVSQSHAPHVRHHHSQSPASLLPKEQQQQQQQQQQLEKKSFAFLQMEPSLSLFEEDESETHCAPLSKGPKATLQFSPPLESPGTHAATPPV